MRLRFTRPATVAVLVAVAVPFAGVSAPVFAQAPAAPPPVEPASAGTPPTASPPRPPGDGGLFPVPGASARPAPPRTPNAGELRRSNTAGGRGAAAARRERRRGGGADPAFAQAADDPVEIRIAYRRAETEAKRDPRFNELLREADAAPDDETRRAFLREYYTTLFERVRRLNRSPAFAAHVNVLARAARQRYAPERRAGGTDEMSANRDRGSRR